MLRSGVRVPLAPPRQSARYVWTARFSLFAAATGDSNGRGGEWQPGGLPEPRPGLFRRRGRVPLAPPRQSARLVRTARFSFFAAAGGDSNGRGSEWQPSGLAEPRPGLVRRRGRVPLAPPRQSARLVRTARFSFFAAAGGDSNGRGSEWQPSGLAEPRPGLVRRRGRVPLAPPRQSTRFVETARFSLFAAAGGDSNGRGSEWQPGGLPEPRPGLVRRRGRVPLAPPERSARFSFHARPRGFAWI